MVNAAEIVKCRTNWDVVISSDGCPYKMISTRTGELIPGCICSIKGSTFTDYNCTPYNCPLNAVSMIAATGLIIKLMNDMHELRQIAQNQEDAEDG